MNLTAQISDTDINQAKLISKLSGRPAHVYKDIFVWNGHLIDRATAIVLLLKTNNQVPVGDSIKLSMHKNYNAKFEQFKDCEHWADISHEEPDVAARMWFGLVGRELRRETPFSHEQVKQILIDLHSY